MPRKIRVESPGAIYHIMSRGNRRGEIYLDDVDRQDFIKTLAEACLSDCIWPPGEGCHRLQASKGIHHESKMGCSEAPYGKLDLRVKPAAETSCAACTTGLV